MKKLKSLIPILTIILISTLFIAGCTLPKDLSFKNITLPKDIELKNITFPKDIQLKNISLPSTNPSNQNNEQTPNKCSSDADCIKAGCSGILCTPKSQQENSFTTCEWQEYYACFQDQNCICKDNRCSWDKEEKLNECMANELEKYF